MIACALYTRVSSRGQLDGDYNSLETQRERLEAYCKSQGWDVYRVYEDGGYSAETLNRPALKDMLRDIASGKVQRVIAYKIDRLTRSVKDFHALMEIFEKSNVCFVSVTQSIDTSTPTGRLMRNILLDFAQFEREMTADRTRDKLHQRAQKGMWNGGTAPYGYGKKDKKLVVNPEEAKVVRFMFQQFADDPNLARMRAELHRRGWLTRAGGKWGKAVLHHILRNPVYCGETRFLEHTYKGEHESIVDETLFKRVQTAPPNRTHERTRIQRTFLLKGLAKCGDCGSFLTPHYTQKRRKDGSVNRISYYRCTRTIHHDKNACQVRGMNADLAEGAVVEDLCKLALDKPFLDGTVEALNQDIREKSGPLEQEAAQIRRRLAEIEKEIARFMDAFGKGTLPLERLEAEVTKREEAGKTLKAQMDDLQRRINEGAFKEYDANLARQHLQNFQRTFHALEPQEKAEALQFILKEVVVYPDRMALEIYDLPELGEGSTNRTTWLLG